MGGGGSTYDYGFRIYNASLGKFLSVDPLSDDFPWLSCYQFAGNRPICSIDFDGLEDIFFMDSFLKNEGQAIFDKLNSTDLGKGLVDLFKLETPITIGPLKYPENQGYDIFITSVLMSPNGSTYPSLNPNSTIYRRVLHNYEEQTPEDANKLMTFQEIALEGINKGEGPAYEWLMDNFGQEIVLSCEFEESIRKGRGIIVIRINPTVIKEGFTNEIDSQASTLAHELGAHAINDSREFNVPQIDEHLFFNGVSAERVGDLKTKGSLQDNIDTEIVNLK
jgi:hypothetical protein